LYYSYGFVLANKDLKPEKSFGFDFGFIVNMNGFFLECVTFMNYYLDLIKYILSYGYVYRPINFSSAISYGLETSFIFNPINFFKLEIAYTLNFLNDIYMLTISKFYQLPGQPLHSASFILEFLIKFFTIGFKVRIEDRININDTATKYIDPKTIIDIYLKFDFEKRLTLFVFFNNITNIYREDFRNYPLEGFNFKMGVNIEI
jgi:Outer membrane receptor for ferrienterochelin and colicins